MAIKYINLTDTDVLDPNAPHAPLDNFVSDGTGADPAGSDTVTVQLVMAGPTPGPSIVADPTDVDLTPVDPTATLFTYVALGQAEVGGSGNFPAFLRMGANTIEKGFNTDNPGGTLDDKASAQLTHSLALADLQPVTGPDGVTQYYEFRLDLNQSGSNPNIVLDELKIYTSNNIAELVDFNSANDTLVGTAQDGSVFHLAYDLGGNAILLRSHNSGLGHDDYVIDVPVADFTASDTYVTLFAKFGGLSGFDSNSGFEQFRAVTKPSASGGGEGAFVIAKDYGLAGPNDTSDTGAVTYAGETIYYTITLFNDGQDPLTLQQLTDSIPDSQLHLVGPTGDNGNGVFDPGETWVFTTTHVVTQAEMNAGGNNPADPGYIDNVATAAFTDGGATIGPESSEVLTPIVQTPGLTIVKYVSVDGGTTWADANSVTGPTLLDGFAAPEFKYVVSNTGNVDLAGVVVTDDKLGAVGTTDVGAGQSVTLYDTGAWAEGQNTNVGDAKWSFTNFTNTTTGGDPTDPANYFGAAPDVTIVKYVSVDGGTTWFDANSATGPTLLSGFAAPMFKYVVTNDGNVDLAVIVVTDNVLGAEGSGNLFAGGSATLYATGTWAAGQQTNVGDASWSYTDSAGNKASGDPTDPANYFGAAPDVTIVKYVSVDGGATWFDANSATGPTLLSGHAAPQFKYVVTNDGNVALSGIVVSDDKLGAVGAVDLAAGASTTLYETGTWAQGQQTNVGDAHWSYTDTAGDQAGGDPTDPANYFGAAPSIGVVKVTTGKDAGGVTHTGDGINIAEGNAVTWTYTVTNTGNVALASVSVTDSISGVTPTPVLSGGFNVGDVNHNGLLDLTESWVYTASGTAIAGSYSNIGTTSGSYMDSAGNTGTATATDPSSYIGQFVEGTPGLTIGFWYNHHTISEVTGTKFVQNAWHETFVTYTDPGTGKATTVQGVLLGDYSGTLWASYNDKGHALQASDFAAGGVAAGMLFISDTAAGQLINSSQSANDTRQTLLSQAIAAQLNINAGDKDPGYNGTTGATQNLITEAVNWLEGSPLAGGKIDTNGDGILTAGAGAAYEYNTTTHAFTSPTMTSSNPAWQTQEAIYFAADWHPAGVGVNAAGSGAAYSADGEGLKNALQAFNQNLLVTTKDGLYVAWDPSGSTSGPFIDIVANGANDFWSILHLQAASLHGIL